MEIDPEEKAKLIKYGDFVDGQTKKLDIQFQIMVEEITAFHEEFCQDKSASCLKDFTMRTIEYATRKTERPFSDVVKQALDDLEREANEAAVEIYLFTVQRG